jgi:hypothetical protein
LTLNIASDGGGIFNYLGKVELEAGSRVTDNTAVYGGGGMFIDTGTVELKAGSRVTGNTADFAGGIYINDGGFINDGGMVTVDDNALVCNNTPGDDQCFNPSDAAIANCPNPSDGICR